jgi:hypothetical protein
MTDLSPTLSTILVQKHASTALRQGGRANLAANLDSFLEEAYRIVGLCIHPVVSSNPHKMWFLTSCCSHRINPLRYY